MHISRNIFPSKQEDNVQEPLVGSSEADPLISQPQDLSIASSVISYNDFQSEVAMKTLVVVAKWVTERGGMRFYLRWSLHGRRTWFLELEQQPVWPHDLATTSL
uniref:Uncharacterized protein n=1 Tax=Timema tahoe TaxID=61484 RepID=A0A7R9IIY8_9NEOP|nr:unnamed protein product [Timema tahoe]